MQYWLADYWGAVMDIGVEISLYPLKDDYRPQIRAFIDQLSRDQRLKVVTNSMSTQIFGAFEVVMDVLRGALGASFSGLDPEAQRAVFVMKVFGPLPPA
jgi:uncharacterized protein YqgV (UPF0045/DUF77 family)